jgi:hypothetical protein
MNPVSAFKDFHRYLRTSFPEAGIPAHPEWDAEIALYGETYLSEVMNILKKSESFFESERLVFGFDIRRVEDKDELWKHIQACLIASFLSGDIKEKLGTLLEKVKSLWGESGHSTDGIDQILNDETTKDKLSGLLEFLMSTRIATLVKSVFESFDTSEFSFESPEDVTELFRNPEHPTIQKISTRIKGILEQKLQSGEFSKEVIIHEMELIKNKLRDSFGDMVNGMFGIDTREDSTSAEVLLSHHPDARRARMLARLQRKQKDKGRKTL